MQLGFGITCTAKAYAFHCTSISLRLSGDTSPFRFELQKFQKFDAFTWGLNLWLGVYIPRRTYFFSALAHVAVYSGSLRVRV